MLPINDEVKDLRKLLSSYTGISESSMLITEITNDGFQRSFSGEECLRKFLRILRVSRTRRIIFATIVEHFLDVVPEREL